MEERTNGQSALEEHVDLVADNSPNELLPTLNYSPLRKKHSSVKKKILIGAAITIGLFSSAYLAHKFIQNYVLDSVNFYPG